MIDPYQRRGRRARRAYTARRIALIVAIFVLLLGFMFAATGCSPGEDTSHGSITALRFTPAHDEDVEVEDWTVVCTGGQYPSCSSVYLGSHTETRHRPDVWTAKAFNCDSDGCWDFDREVPKQVYCGLAIGSWVDFDKPDEYLNVSRYARIDSQAKEAGEEGATCAEGVTQPEPLSEG